MNVRMTGQPNEIVQVAPVNTENQAVQAAPVAEPVVAPRADTVEITGASPEVVDATLRQNEALLEVRQAAGDIIDAVADVGNIPEGIAQDFGNVIEMAQELGLDTENLEELVVEITEPLVPGVATDMAQELTDFVVTVDQEVEAQRVALLEQEQLAQEDLITTRDEAQLVETGSRAAIENYAQEALQAQQNLAEGVVAQLYIA